ncbi:MAG TPA: hypothetical protein VGC27_04320 [Rhizomicrobium sp.]
MSITKVVQLCSVLLVIASVGANAEARNPCGGVDRGLPAKYKAELEPALAKQLRVPKADVLEMMRDGKWSVIYVDSHDADEAFLFYAGDPLRTHYVSAWSGAAGRNEELAIKRWVTLNVKGVPVRLARCFAWHVTQDRTQ